MATLLDEILIDSAPRQVRIPDAYGASHSPGCNCVYCKSTGYQSPGLHKYWRQRRGERLCAPQQVPAVSRSLPNAKGTFPPIIKIGGLKSAALVNQWKEKLKRTTNPVAKQRYKKYILVVLRKQRPSPHQSEKDLQWLLAKKTNLPTARNSDTSIVIKNYSLQNQDTFIRWLQKQIARRMQQGVNGGLGISPQQQKLILDMRGQNATKNQLKQLARRIVHETGLLQNNVKVVTW